MIHTFEIVPSSWAIDINNLYYFKLNLNRKSTKILFSPMFITLR